ncbi:hypothetical protein GW17_00004482 [Ensete ventricosum]|nr:hypothetical protein GW17_00004482 [Ensete ventricosum]
MPHDVRSKTDAFLFGSVVPLLAFDAEENVRVGGTIKGRRGRGWTSVAYEAKEADGGVGDGCIRDGDLDTRRSSDRFAFEGRHVGRLGEHAVPDQVSGDLSPRRWGALRPSEGRLLLG